MGIFISLCLFTFTIIFFKISAIYFHLHDTSSVEFISHNKRPPFCSVMHHIRVKFATPTNILRRHTNVWETILWNKKKNEREFSWLLPRSSHSNSVARNLYSFGGIYVNSRATLDSKGKKKKLAFNLGYILRARMGSKFGVRREWVVNATHRPPYHWERKYVPVVEGAGWAAVAVRIGGENLTPPLGIRSPDLPVHRESLYRLSYPGPWSAH